MKAPGMPAATPLFLSLIGAVVPPVAGLPPTADGLTSESAAERLRTFGANEIPEKQERAALRFFRKFWGLTPGMLGLTAALTWLLGNLVDTYVVLGLLLLNALLGFAQEQRAGAAIEYLRQRLRVTARVKRDSIWTTVPARDLVPEDLIRVRTGDFVPADLRISEGSVDVDQSALTGESIQAEKGPGETVASGSTVTRGEATAVVTATGSRTYYGRTVELVEIAKPRLHMEEVTSRLVQWLLILVGVFVAVGLVGTAIRGGDIVEILPLAVVLMVSAIPVALPTMFTISMALGSLELARKGVLITRLSAGEDAATMDVLCADKTGTITVNRLRVTEVAALGDFTEVDVLRFAALASQEANRDPIDLAVLEAAQQRRIDPDGWIQRDFVPFNPSTRRTAAAIEREGRKLFVLKGAMSAVAPHGSPGDGSDRIAHEVERLSAKGFRALAVAIGPSLDKTTPVGILAFADPPREDSRRFLEDLSELHISVKMLTGDALPIAREIAAEVDLGGPVRRISEIKASLESGHGFEAVDQAKGFAEIYPEDKYLVVKALQRHRHIVGMTGDGVNDAPALKQAEVGIAVSNATDVAKRSASVVLTKEGLTGIVDLVKSGRRIYQRILTWILNKIAKTFQIVVFVVLAFLLSGQFVVSVFSMILFLFLTDFVTLSLATDSVRYSSTPDSWDIRALVRIGVLLGIAIVAESLVLLYLGTEWFGLASDVPRLQTFVFDYIVFLGVLHVLVLRERRHFWESRPSHTLTLAVGLDILLVAALSYAGFFQLAPIGLAPILTALAVSGALAFLVNDFLKVQLVRRLVPWA